MIRDTLVAGKTIMTRCFASTRIKTEKGQKRKRKGNPTPEAVRKINLKNAIWILCALLNTYFGEGDLHLVLTYAKEPDKRQAKKDLDKFIGGMRKHHKKNKRSLHWVSTTEYRHKRIHHHFVCSKTDLDLVRELWPHGWVKPVALDGSGNYIRLAEYLIKETEKTFREEDSPNKQRYRRSRNMPLPKPQRETISERVVKDGPKAPDGYYIDQDTVHVYDHAILGVECVQYIAVSERREPRLKRWYRGKRVPMEREHKVPEERQLTLDGLVCSGEGEHHG